MNIQIIDRDCSRSEWEHIWRIMRKVGEAPSRTDESVLAERAELAQTIAECVEDDKLCIVTSGRDCDCVEFVYSTLMSRPTVMRLWSEERDTFYWADGPISIGYCRPSERPGNYSRDLVMEAFENGHPHFVCSAI